MVKQEAINVIGNLPDSATWDDIFYSLYVILKIEKGRQEANDGKGISIEDARKKLGIA